MEIGAFTRMLKDKHFYDLKKLRYKYPEDFGEFTETLKKYYYVELPLLDHEGKKTVYLENFAGKNHKAGKTLMTSQNSAYSPKAVGEEIISTAEIEKIEFDRDSVRSIMKGRAPRDEAEDRIYGLKRGFDFIADPDSRITEENIYKLYMMTVGDFLEEESRLLPGHYYRHDAVYVVGSRIEHTGMEHGRLPAAMKALVDFINTEDGTDELVKAAIIHFYIAYIHPYFDGNGRMARLMHLWYLVRQGYKTALFIPFSSLITRNVRQYYEAFTLIEENRKFSGVIDLTPFIGFFAEYVYRNIGERIRPDGLTEEYENALADGKITEKESKLWDYVLSSYGEEEFSTKQLEKDYGNAAYATIRGFVLKFEKLGLLSSRSFGNRVKYRLST